MSFSFKMITLKVSEHVCAILGSMAPSGVSLGHERYHSFPVE